MITYAVEARRATLERAELKNGEREEPTKSPTVIYRNVEGACTRFQETRGKIKS